jgi:hypothetical protein
MPGAKPSYLQTFEAGLYHKPSYLSNLHMQGLGIILSIQWFVKPILLQNHAIKKPTNGEKFVDFVIFFLESFKKINKPR